MSRSLFTSALTGVKEKVDEIGAQRTPTRFPVESLKDPTISFHLYGISLTLANLIRPGLEMPRMRKNIRYRSD